MRPSNLWIVRMSEHLSDKVSHWVRTLDSINRWSTGLQVLRSADSVTANLTEGFGRDKAADKLRFYCIARASLEETLFWIRRARDRELIEYELGSSLLESYRKLSLSLQSFIRSHESRNNL